MQSFATSEFWKAYKKLPPELQEKANNTYHLWQANQDYPSLHFKKVGKNLWSIRITNNYRALALKKGDDYYWFWIGNHAEYERLINS
ncbi:MULTISPECIES: ParE family toxin-like protein [unclassified Picosynechococcus]|uniref:ParE family toxin-like protein n=1 Tax=unclassified Picosynechococcus TaxID=3079910 RepID=UPI0004AABF2A|nr:hypothetical protein AWQ23_04250 [Picosynechococcus sp. PCC 73109]